MGGNFNVELYKALVAKNQSDVLLHVQDKGPMQVVNIHQDSALHIAIYSMQVDLVRKLLRMLSDSDHELLMTKNSVGNTILHEAVTCDKFHVVAKWMLDREPRLLTEMNHDQETPLFQAVRYGQKKMFKLLDEVATETLNASEKDKICCKADGNTILHAAIDAEHFELAIRIAEKQKHLHDKKNHKKLTALQLLACNPLAFQSRDDGWLMRFIDSRIKIHSSFQEEEEEEDSSYLHDGGIKSGYTIPWWNEMVMKRKKYNAAVKLAKLLITTDESWKTTQYIGKKYAQTTEDEHEQEGEQRSDSKIGDKKLEDEVKKIRVQLNEIGKELKTIGEVVKKQDEDAVKEMEAVKKKEERKQLPLLLATQTGCFEIVEEILKLHPQAVDQIDEDGRCILHIAIKYRQMVVFEMVKHMEVPMRRLTRKRDVKGNSILHMVGKKIRNEAVEETEKRSPSFQLQDDLLLFERIKKVISPHFHKHTNRHGATAEELLILHKEGLREKAQEWLKRTAENCSIVAVLIATVAFAAAYTVPGGSNPESGSPVLIKQTFFVIFTIGDVLSLTFCLTAVVIFLSILTSSFQLQEFKHKLPQKLMIGITCLIFAVTTMMLAFAATIILMIHNNEQWTRIALYTVAFLPVTVFAGVYLPLYMSLMGTFKYSLMQIASFLPKSYCKNIDKALDEKNKNEANELVDIDIARRSPTNNSQSLV